MWWRRPRPADAEYRPDPGHTMGDPKKADETEKTGGGFYFRSPGEVEHATLCRYHTVVEIGCRLCRACGRAVIRGNQYSPHPETGEVHTHRRSGDHSTEVRSHNRHE